ncbi:MAG: S41 family peptidase [Bacilli bacterium]
MKEKETAKNSKKTTPKKVVKIVKKDSSSSIQKKEEINNDSDKKIIDKKDDTSVKKETKIEKPIIIDNQNNEQVKKQKSSLNKKIYNKNEVITYFLVLFLILSLLYSIGALFLYNKFQNNEISNNYEINNTNLPKEFSKLEEVYKKVINNYYSDYKTDDLIDGAINGMLLALGDPYTTYYNSEDNEDFNIRLEGEYHGIGSEIGMNSKGEIYISKPFANSPAEKAGLKIGDILLEANGKEIKNMSTSSTASIIMGAKGTIVNLKIKRGEEILNIDVTRNKITIPYVVSKIIEKDGKKIGYIDIELFAATTPEQFLEHLLKLEKKNIDSLIIDVRDNTGGYLGSVKEMIALFTKKGDIMYQIDTMDKINKYEDTTNEKRTYPVAVLVNKYSASASEILAAAFKDSYGSEIIGAKTYGKGTVQQPFELSNGSMVKVTTEKWLTPKGSSIDQVGITPTIEILNDSKDVDSQLEKATEVLSK